VEEQTLTGKAVVFDWGGVLMQTVDPEPRHRWDRRLGLPPGSVENVVHGIEAWDRAQRGEISVEDYWEAVRVMLKLTPAALVDLRKDFYSGDALSEELLVVIRGLRTKGILIGLLSNNSLELVDMLTTMQIDQIFDACVISAQIGIMKPAPAAYRTILQQMGIKPSQALLIDDSLRNIEGALALGMEAICYVPGIDLPALIEAWIDDQEHFTI
jgi:putative hydrolase of the HAD superfamily